MKTIFDPDLRHQLIDRIRNAHSDDQARWGEMNVVQMLKHNTYWNRWILGYGDFNYTQTFLGKLFGKIALWFMIKDDKSLDKNIPTSDQFKVREFTGNFEDEKQAWISLIGEYARYENPAFIHDFFGKMTKEQIGILVYKHTDHHLRQFGL